MCWQRKMSQQPTVASILTLLQPPQRSVANPLHAAHSVKFCISPSSANTNSTVLLTFPGIQILEDIESLSKVSENSNTDHGRASICRLVGKEILYSDDECTACDFTPIFLAKLDPAPVQRQKALLGLFSQG